MKRGHTCGVFSDLFTLAAHYIETKEIAPTPDASMRVCLWNQCKDEKNLGFVHFYGQRNCKHTSYQTIVALSL